LRGGHGKPCPYKRDYSGNHPAEADNHAANPLPLPAKADERPTTSFLYPIKADGRPAKVAELPLSSDAHPAKVDKHPDWLDKHLTTPDEDGFSFLPTLPSCKSFRLKV